MNLFFSHEHHAIQRWNVFMYLLCHCRVHDRYANNCFFWWKITYWLIRHINHFTMTVGDWSLKKNVDRAWILEASLPWNAMCIITLQYNSLVLQTFLRRQQSIAGICKGLVFNDTFKTIEECKRAFNYCKRLMLWINSRI